MGALVFKINGLSINDGSNGLALDDQVDGLGLPDIRTSSGLLSGQSGGYVGAQFFGNRYIALSGRASSPDIAALFALRRLLESTLAPLTSYPVEVMTYDGRSFLLNAYVTKLDMPIDGIINRTNFKIELVAPDPIIYDNTSGSELTAPFSKIVAGGFSWPIKWPLVWQPGTGPTTITNNGSVYILPKITLTGVHTNAVITNLTTGQVFKFVGLTTGPGDVVVIDMRARTVTLNGGSILNKVSADSTFWGLKVGGNDITLNTGSGSDNVTGLFSWRSGVMGI